MPPEVVRNRNTRGTAVDLWALGVLVYQLCAGALPYTGGGPLAVFLAMERGDLDLGPLDEPAADLVRQLLRPAPAARLGVVGDDGDVAATRELQRRCRERRAAGEEVGGAGDGLVGTQVEEAEEEEEAGPSTTPTEGAAASSSSSSSLPQPASAPGEWCPLRRRRLEAPLHQAHVDSTPEGWAAVKAHAFFAGVDWSDLRLGERLRGQLEAVAEADGGRRRAVAGPAAEAVDMEALDRAFGDEVSDDVPGPEGAEAEAEAEGKVE
jgi:hypothetical protein